jgi:flagellar motor switch protein FliM
MTMVGAAIKVKKASLIQQTEEQSAYPGLDRMARLFASELALLMAERNVPAATAQWVGTSFGSFEDWLSQSAQRQVSVRFRMAPLKGCVLLTLPLDLISLLVDRQYGGDGNFRTDRIALTAAEARYLLRMAERIGASLKTAWKDSAAIESAVVNLETSGASPTLVPGTHKVAIQKISMQLEPKLTFDFALITPMSVVRAVPGLVDPVAQEEASPIDPVWQAAFTKSVMDVTLPIKTIFARPELPLAQLLTLQPGDIIPICLPDKLPVTIAGRHFAAASMGEANGRAAIRIEHMETESSRHE